MTTRRIAGSAGLVYAAAAAIENMGLLEAPTLGSPVADVRAQYEDQALALVTSLAGALELVAYCVFAVALFGLLREGERRGDAWSLLALVGGIAGPVVAAAGLTATGVLVADGGARLGDGAIATLFDLSLSARMLSGGFLALFLAGVGISALRSRTLPRWLGWYACAAALPLALAPVAAFTVDDGVQVAARTAFSLQALWIFVTSFWLALADGGERVAFVRRCAFLLLVLGAGLVGTALVLVPGATGEFFAWGLGPEPLAAFAGGVYLGSAAVYALALRSEEFDPHGLVVGAVVLSVSVLVITLTHLDQFDFGRLQAWAWVVLFAGFSLVTSVVLALGRRTPSKRVSGEPLTPAARAALTVVAGVLGALALALWVDPGALSSASPFDLSPLGGRFAGSWIALLAVLAGWAALRNHRGEARASVAALIALPAGMLVAALRTLPDLEPGGAAIAYVGAIALLLATGAALAAGRARSRVKMSPARA
jgi:Domain of unknown function (DUF4386)